MKTESISPEHYKNETYPEMNSCILNTEMNPCILDTNINSCILNPEMNPCILNPEMNPCILDTEMNPCILNPVMNPCIPWIQKLTPASACKSDYYSLFLTLYLVFKYSISTLFLFAPDFFQFCLPACQAAKGLLVFSQLVLLTRN